jgi:hypothetical protein
LCKEGSLEICSNMPQMRKTASRIDTRVVKSVVQIYLSLHYFACSSGFLIKIYKFLKIVIIIC